MDLFASFFLANMLVLILEQEGYCLSVVSDSTASDRPSEVEQAKRVAHREKRCSCENLRDKECVFFCHIGIVWVNTPRQVVPYGEGSFPARMKRNVGRCACAYTSDSGCLQFCRASKLRHEHVGLTRFEKMFPAKSREKYDKNMEQMDGKSIATQKT